jgi:hypothetical protein
MWKTLGKGQPQDLEEMIKFMEQQDNIQKSNRAKIKPQHDGNNKGSKKRKGDFNQKNNSFKKSKKHCALCDQYGGPTKTHNTANCRIYSSDGTRKQGKSNGDKKTNKIFAQLLKVAQDEIQECKKEIKRLKRRGQLRKLKATATPEGVGWVV